MTKMAKPSDSGNKGGNKQNGHQGHTPGDKMLEICLRWYPIVQAAKDNAEKERLEAKGREEMTEMWVKLITRV